MGSYTKQGKMKKLALKSADVPPIKLQPLPGSSKWLTEVSLLKEKVRMGEKVTKSGINRSGLTNPLFTREKKEEADSLNDRDYSNNDRVKYREALVNIISKDTDKEQNKALNHIETSNCRLCSQEIM